MRRRQRKKLVRLCPIAVKRAPWSASFTALWMHRYHQYEKEIIESRGMDVHSAYLRAVRKNILQRSAQVGNTKRLFDALMLGAVGVPFFDKEDYLP